MNCPKGWQNCKICKMEFYGMEAVGNKFNPWLPHNEKLVDFVRWKEMFTVLGFFAIMTLVWGWIGLGLALFMRNVWGKFGGLNFSFDDHPPPKIVYKKCKLGHVNCPYKAIIT